MNSRFSSLKKNIYLFFFSFLFFLLLLEGTIFILTKFGRISIDEPGYSLDVVKHRFWADLNPDFGTWHENFAKFHLKKSCIDAEYDANSYGARDIDRKKISENSRMVVLGDSFVEGYGVTVEKRFTNLLEAKTKVEHLNFGTAGVFGPTQYYLLYKTLAKNFSHDAIMIGILPFNDFFDDDFEFGRKAYTNRYRPYLIGKYPNYQLVYYNLNKMVHPFSTLQGFEKAQNFVRGFLAGYTYTYNALNRLISVLSLRHVMEEQKVFSSYYEYKPEQYDRLRYSIEKIQEEANGKKVILVTFPVLSDFKRYDVAGESPLSKQLKELTKEKGILYIDLLPAMHDLTTSWEKYFLPCDGHWSEMGNSTAAKILEEKIPYSFFFKNRIDPK